jgi:hypothetical protein
MENKNLHRGRTGPPALPTGVTPHLTRSQRKLTLSMGRTFPTGPTLFAERLVEPVVRELLENMSRPADVRAMAKIGVNMSGGFRASQTVAE